MEYMVVKWLHILSSTFLFGTGVGSAFFMLLTSLTRDVHATAVVARFVVIADWLFTTPTIILQPLTGLYLMHLAGMPMSTKWIHWSFALYFIAVACWLPVVWLQIKMRNFARKAVRKGYAAAEHLLALLEDMGIARRSGVLCFRRGVLPDGCQAYGMSGFRHPHINEMP